MADDPHTELREAYRQPPKPYKLYEWERYAKNPKTGKKHQWKVLASGEVTHHIRSGASVNLRVQKWYKPKLNKYGEPKLYLSELDVIELEFALGMFKDIYINNIHNMKYKEKMQEAHWYADYALLICKNAAKSETERRYNEWKTNEIQRRGQDSGKKPHDREQRGWYK